MSIADWVGIYGAALATFLAILELFKHRLERPGVRVRAHLARITLTFVVPGRTVRYRSESVETGNDPFLAFHITNPRRVQNTVARVGGVLHDGDEFSLTYDPVPLPKQILPGDHIAFAADPTVVSDDLYCLAVWDGYGKVWKVPRWNLLVVKMQAGVVHLRCRWLRHLLVRLAEREARR